MVARAVRVAGKTVAITETVCWAGKEAMPEMVEPTLGTVAMQVTAEPAVEVAAKVVSWAARRVAAQTAEAATVARLISVEEVVPVKAMASISALCWTTAKASLVRPPK